MFVFAHLLLGGLVILSEKCRSATRRIPVLIIGLAGEFEAKVAGNGTDNKFGFDGKKV